MSAPLGPTINSLPIFSALTVAEAEDLARSSEVSRLEDGDLLFAQDAPSDDLYVVISGVVRLSCLGPGGVHVVVGKVAGGEVLGEMGVIDGMPRSASAHALGGAVVLRLAGDAFGRMIEAGHPAAWWIVRKIRSDLCERLRQVDERIDAVFTPDAVPPRGEVGLGQRMRTLWAVLRGVT